MDSGFSGDFLSNGGLQTKAQMEGSTPVTLLMDGTTSDGVPTLVGYLGKSSCKNKILTGNNWSGNGYLQRSTLECGIDNTVGLFRRFALFHPCIDQKVYHAVG